MSDNLERMARALAACDGRNIDANLRVSSRAELAAAGLACAREIVGEKVPERQVTSDGAIGKIGWNAGRAAALAALTPEEKG